MSQYAPITTNNQGEYRRLRTDNEKTEFFQGREFRSLVELSLGNGASITFKLVSLVDFVLYDQELEGVTGSLKLEFYTGGTQATAFNTPLPIFGKNQMASRPKPYYTSKVTIDSGGTFTGGTKDGILHAIVGTNNGQNTNASMSKDVHDARGYPAGTYYIKITNLNASATATGVYKLWWAEKIL